MFTHELLLVSECPTVRVQEWELEAEAGVVPSGTLPGDSCFPSPQLYALKLEVLVPVVLGEDGYRWEEGPFYFPTTEFKTTPAAWSPGTAPTR